jgi:hypothetical protein
MAVEQSGAKAAPEPDHLAQPAAARQPAAPAPAAEADFDEVKRKFREALDRKRGAHASAEGAREADKVPGSRGPAVSRRSFRRKSGG